MDPLAPLLTTPSANVHHIKQRQKDKPKGFGLHRKNNRKNTKARRTQQIYWLEYTDQGYTMRSKTIKHGI